MKPVWGYDDLVAKWVSERIPNCERGFAEPRSLAVLAEDDTMAAGVVYHNWNPERGTIELSVAADNPRWLARNVIRAMYSYPFDGIGCQMVFVVVSAQNSRPSGRGLVSGLLRFGYQPHPIPRMFGRHEDGIFYTLTDDAWRATKFARNL